LGDNVPSATRRKGEAKDEQEEGGGAVNRLVRGRKEEWHKKKDFQMWRRKYRYRGPGGLWKRGGNCEVMDGLEKEGDSKFENVRRRSKKKLLYPKEAKKKEKTLR